MSSSISSANSEYIKALGEKAREASTILAKASSQVKNSTLNTLGELLIKNAREIYLANEKDLIAGKEKGLSEAFLDRLTISEKVLNQMCLGLKQIAGLNDPIAAIGNSSWKNESAPWSYWNYLRVPP